MGASDGTAAAAGSGACPRLLVVCGDDLESELGEQRSVPWEWRSLEIVI